MKYKSIFFPFIRTTATAIIINTKWGKIELRSFTIGNILSLKFIFLTKKEYCLIIFDDPFRFSEKTEVEINELSNRFIHLKSYSSDKLRRFWKNLKFGDNLFNNHKMPLSIITNRTYLQENDLSEIVPTFKQFLNKMGYFTGEINSIFGYDLRSAVIQYQTLRHLTADGVIGNKTINKMREDGLGEVSIEYIYNDN